MIRPNLKLKFLLTLAIMSLTSILASGQDTTVHVVQDVETWTSTRFTYKYNKKLKFKISENLRLAHNSSEFNQWFTELGAQYKIMKGFSVEFETRYGVNSTNSTNESFLRLFYAAEYAYKLDRLTLEGRVAYQNKHSERVSGLTFNDIENRLRLKVCAGYNIKGWKLDPKASIEYFKEPSDTANFNKFRLKLGTNYDLGNYGKIAGFIAYENELNKEYPLKATIIGLTYTYSFKRKTKN